ncbi:MAG: haloacid dehalogenase-like hydrolase [Cyclobacteriaceae bacterium]|nr:haloacid dehalogenase-like hydrolase [Cyclobacteriaceae bacterium]
MKNLLILICSLLIFSCQPKHQEVEIIAAEDPLPSWNDTPNKKSIIEFVTAVTTEGDAKFVPVAERIATFDNDGTLWCEQPLYFEFLFSIDAVRYAGKENHALITSPEMKALVAGDMKTFMQRGEKGLMEALMISHTAMSVDEFNTLTKSWLDTAVHKRFGKKYGELTYQPMVELLQYLRDKQFKTYIVSGGTTAFMRNFAEGTYGIPPEQTVGTMFAAEFVDKDGSYQVNLKPQLFHFDDKEGKPVAIYQFIGRKPILAFGNSDGDLQMLQWTSTNSLPNLELILHHTDSVREYAYDRESHIGKLDKALDEGRQKGWVIVDMEKDFKTVFSFQ